MIQKVKDALHHRDDMRIQMEEAFTTKEAVSTVTDLLIVNATLVVQYVFCFYLNAIPTLVQVPLLQVAKELCLFCIYIASFLKKTGLYFVIRLLWKDKVK